MVKINFEETYPSVQIASDWSFMTFFIEDKEGNEVLLRVEINSLNNPFLPNVYNLAYGPVGTNEIIDDKARIHHSSPNKVFSTILLFSYTFLTQNPKLSIGIDGSSDTRAYLYHRMFQLNRHYLDSYFTAFGVDWYVRLLRNGDIEKDSNGLPFFKPQIESFNYEISRTDLYIYYLFRLNA